MGVNSTSSISSTVSIINTVIIVLFIVFVVWEMLHGLRRGIFRQILHTSLMLVAAVVSFVLTRSLLSGTLADYPNMASFLDELDAQGILSLPSHIYSVAADFDVDIVKLLVSLPVSVFALPFVFAIIFAVLNLLVKLIYLIVRLICRIKRGRGPLKRLTGLALGAIEGALVISILLIPFANLADLGSEFGALFASAEEEEPTDTEPIVRDAWLEEDDEFYEDHEDEAVGGDSTPVIDTIGEICSNPIFGIVNAIGGRAVARSLATIEIDGEKVNLRDELLFMAEVLAKDGAVLSEADFNNLTEEDKESLKTLVSDATASKYVATITTGLLSGFANAVYMGDIPIELEAPYDTLLDETVELLRTSNSENIGADAQTYLNIFLIIDETGFIENMTENGAVEALVAKDSSGETVIAKLIDEINKNERTAGLVTALTKLSLSVLSEQIGTGSDSTAIYETVKNDINDEVLSVKKTDYATDKEYMEALTDGVNTTLTDVGIELEPEIVEDIAEYVDENYISQGVTEIDDTQFNDIILSYYDHYLEYKK